MAGPLAGVRVLEVASIGPGPFCAMVLADLGADVLRVERPGHSPTPWQPEVDPLLRGRPAILADLKDDSDRAIVLSLIESADVLVEGFRPGVAERLGIGPEECRGRNPALVYGRMTGWGQYGPLAGMPGHDIDYIAVAGALGAIGPPGGPPVPPLNLVGDFGGGGMLLAVGVLAALWERTASGSGQVVDAAMVDGVALLMTMSHGLRAADMWVDGRGSNLLDGGTPFYDTYPTADGRYVAVGALEPQFFARLIEVTGIEFDPADQWDRSRWDELRRLLGEAIASRMLAEWAGDDGAAEACMAPVLRLGEVAEHPHLAARGTLVSHDGVTQPAPAPRLDRTPTTIRSPSVDELAAAWGLEHHLAEQVLRRAVR